MPCVCTFGPVCLLRSWCFLGDGLWVLTSSWRCANWAWSGLLAASVRHALGVLEYSLRVFWACFRSLVALSRTWVPAGVSVCLSGFSLLLLCWLPLFGACSRRCGACWPPELRYGLPLPWCACFFLDLGCVVCTFGPVCSLTPAGFLAAVRWC